MNLILGGLVNDELDIFSSALLCISPCISLFKVEVWLRFHRWNAPSIFFVPCLDRTRRDALFIPKEIMGIHCCLHIHQSLKISIEVTLSINFTFLIAPILGDANIKVPIVQISTPWVFRDKASHVTVKPIHQASAPFVSLNSHILPQSSVTRPNSGKSSANKGTTLLTSPKYNAMIEILMIVICCGSNGLPFVNNICSVLFQGSFELENRHRFGDFNKLDVES
ncbi:hypothetical protein F383_08793 [Gossypium arboreum]|uniref:Uncharacterized protein n=1 Tax=Gossypium arboreum TaxID=29729 RepID=A0A0B0PDB5_GOSAR|nr:hypothetical protein F383_08793 [Gossypium arboreum]